LQSGLTFLKPQHTPAEFETVLCANVAEVGKSIMELPWVWRRPLAEVVASVRQCHGWEHIETPQANGKSVIILTPHFGCFELVALYTAARLPMVSMYKSPRWKFLDTLMHQGRERGQMKLAPADLGGVRQLLKALKRGEIIGVLPDQVPSNGEGEWVNFFGRPAYTMTLIGRLMQASGAAVVMCHMQRLPRGEGYEMYCTPLALENTHSISAQVNVALENVIRDCPEQYLWSYNRYKTPRGVDSPNNSKES
jgi:KDO2-lipid IV(A) lauroyltransferase